MEKGKLVESGPTETVFTQPQHPYTVRLLNSRAERQVQALKADASIVLAGRDVSVTFSRAEGWFKHSRFIAVNGVNLELRAGETVGVVGESGSGKTTLGMALLGLQPVSGGSVQVDGLALTDATRETLRRIRRRVQVVFQDPFASLNPRLTVGEIIQEGLAWHMSDLTAAELRSRVLATLAEVGLGTTARHEGILERYPHQFSGGERQRIAIARAVVIEPEILVLDEPTSALDVSVQKQVLTLLANLQQRHGMSYLFISHDLSVIRAVAHRILVMKNGVVVEQGETEALIREPQMPYTKTLLQAVAYAGELDVN
jgi:microcin C transport system ATP-binding protein